MSIAVPLALVSRRRDVAAMLEGDPGASRYAITVVDPGAAADAIAASAAVIVDGPGVDDGAAWMRKLRRERPSLEQLAIVAGERAGVDAIRAGAHDFVVWPPREPAALWMAVASLVERAGPPRRGISGTIGGYSLIERLGSGGMADVFLAQKPGEDPIVLKCMRPEIAAEDRYVSMFLEEARISQALSHPNIVRVYDAGGTPDELFIAMEHVPGSNLADIGKEAGWRFPPPLACWIAAEIAAALDHAHRAVDASGARVALIHRDVNPPNVLVRDDGAVKLTDFGIAKTKHHHTRTTQGVLRGKLEYMSPEQVDEQPLDARSDVFSLGSVLYLMLTGELPFTGTTTLQILQRIQQARCDPPSTHDATIPASLDAIVMKALARDRDARYDSAKAFESDLRAWLRAAGGASREDLAAFVRDAAAVRAGAVVPQGSGERGRETLARMPSVITVLSPPRAVTPEVEATAPAAFAVGQDPTVSRAAVVAGDDTTVSRAEEATVARERDPAAGAKTTVGREPAASPDRGERRHDRETVSREPLFPAARPGGDWQRRVAIGGGAALVLALGFLANPFGGRPTWDDPTADPPRGGTPRPTWDDQTGVPPRGGTPRPTWEDPTADPPRGASPRPTWDDQMVIPSRGASPRPTLGGQTAMPPRGASPTWDDDQTAVPPRGEASPRPTATRPLVVRKGTVSIWVLDGWASVSVDGKSLGLNAPVMGLELPEGKHRVTLENAPLKVRKDYDVVIVAGEDTKLRVSIR